MAAVPSVLSALCLAAILAAAAPGARACETALLLAIDVSNSVDPAEYRLQTDGTADALLDPEVREALLRGPVMLSVMQWSGEDDQEMSIPWTEIRSGADIAAFSKAARDMRRAFIQSNTAPGDAILHALRQMGQVVHCKHRIIDISGDGSANAGSETAAARREAERLGVTINGIAIEAIGVAITQYYLRQLVTQHGFVITARRHSDYPRAIREKIIRELAQVTG
jgi:Ca-activated chloride channel family protein